MRRAQRPLNVLIMAGGTGGHVYPALAVAERFQAQGLHVHWLGTREGLEARVVPHARIPLHLIRVRGLRGKGALSWLQAPARLLVALAQSLGVIRRVHPDIVLGMGGFVTGPGGLAAWLMRRPLVIHEQNAIPGLTNRVLGRFARVVMEAFPGSFPPRYRAQHTGNPVRPAIEALPAPEVRLAQRSGPLHVLVLGGSQGARVLNEVVPVALRAMPVPEMVRVCHQAGANHLETARAHYAAAGTQAELVAFIENMAEAYAWADLVVCRAGAMTIAELAAAGAASVLVPFPHAVDDHQTHNARFLSEHGAAVLIRQAELTAQRLCGLLTDLHGARERLLAMARAARALAVPDAAGRVTALCTEVVHA
ncbi:MAG: undecaprenyldiphospho-muramoylpentapeptide beta-N-acetylglucosaminyltransferase [Gammaproteobacteria bacterium]|nr:undecaprenyldiphospho-muramoylpentapeptide beta-N-acetylglucosaminyltransferase [Gammaproteobacteria bacterium]NIR82264.1 undecaprenyldiphospho-muramoylpentapeptide beta-N-acetylglucosaminyltransferase [Gammaproteobacteria bacterium]NIR91195.1 undecaprenyldiphospho-muramoylpentapeptide beta-N-acetylglucosaminyltransferase [Gammaproteobacteria bacterium]NIU03413.1 undecaprenyldiphospho-muramoylpentapeptide beta-N-acetylglucosaminyltransferase [Gammaproteobacteria bacterium]NIX84688.1 undecapr